MGELQMVPDLALKAASDLAAYQFHIVKFSSDRTVTVAAAATDLVIGILQNGDADSDGAPATVRTGGLSKLKAGGSISAGQYVVADGSGHGVAVTLGTTTTNVAIGRAIEDASSGDIFTVLVMPQFIQV